MLFEIRNDEVNADLTDQLKDADAEKIDDGGGMGEEEVERGEELTGQGGVEEDEDEGAFVGCGEEVVGGGFEGHFGICL